MKQLEDMLLKGQWREARDRALDMLAKQPDNPGPAIDAFVGGLNRTLDLFHARPVEEICQDMELELPEAFVQPIQDDVLPRVERIHQWLGILNGVTEERLAREMLSHAVIGDVKAAARSACEMLDRASDEDQLHNHCRQLAAALVELYTNRDRAQAIIKLIGGMDDTGGKAAPILAEEYNRLGLEIHQTALQSNNEAWVRNQTEAVLSFRSSLPGANEAGEPDPDQIERFRREINALLNAGFYNKRQADLIDALTVLHEYCPVDPLPAYKRNIADSSERMFNRLGPCARLVAVRAIASLGDVPSMVKAVLRIAEADREGKRLEVIAAVMGGMRNDDFYPYLKTRLEKTKSEREEEYAIDALGRIANQPAVNLLLERLDKAVRRMNDPAYERRAYGLIRALGRITRAKGSDPALRLKIIGKVIEVVDRGQDRHLSFHAAHILFSVRLHELPANQKRWAAIRTVEVLWAKPPGNPMAPGYGLQDWRSPMVETLNRLGSDVLPVILETADKFATQMNGAMNSLASVLAEIGDKRAVPLLELMAQTVLLHSDDDSKSPLLKDKTFDIVSGQMKDLDRDDVLHSILYALNKIGGHDGVKVILRIADEVQSGRINLPGDLTAQLLVDTRLKQGGDVAAPRASLKDIKVDPKVLKKALSEAKGGFFIKNPTRVAAIARLGTMPRLESVPLLVKLLGDKETMISSAAHIALSQFFRPLPIESDFSMIMDAILVECMRLKGTTMERLLDFMRRELPKRPPYDHLIERQIQAQIENPELAHRLRGATTATDEEASIPDQPEAVEAKNPSQPVSPGRTALDQRREYMLARKAWIEGGKVGQPPTPPGEA